MTVALIITIIAYFKVLKSYTKVIPQVNVFDVVLEILSMFGIYAFCINSLIGIFYYYYLKNNENNGSAEVIQNSYSASNGDTGSPLNKSIPVLIIVSAFLSIIQGTIQTFFILECLRRYAYNKRELVRKPARELITALLLVNVSLWCYDTVSSKRFDTNSNIWSYWLK